MDVFIWTVKDEAEARAVVRSGFAVVLLTDSIGVQGNSHTILGNLDQPLGPVPPSPNHAPSYTHSHPHTHAPSTTPLPPTPTMPLYGIPQWHPLEAVLSRLGEEL
eukprot:GHVU01229928.1.p1 GENE.GHVU01229928.1~~GHVU01229928.1.p1  ORF type:complete len:105 (-),score=1.23 GHVU01229928.1:44-358(-)